MKQNGHLNSHSDSKAYIQLLLMAALHFPIMYAVMFAMVWTLDEIFHNINTAYMAGMMVAPMVLLMPLMMRTMYQNRRLNIVVYTLSAGLFLLLFVFMREQTFVGDKQFVRSMIPHHSGAILMCEEAQLQDLELKSLCEEIVKAQKAEIAQMKQILERID